MLKQCSETKWNKLWLISVNFRNKMKQSQVETMFRMKQTFKLLKTCSRVNSRPRAPVVARDSSLTRAVPRILCLSGVGNKGTSFRLLFEHSCKLFPDVVPLWCRFFRLPMIVLILPLSPGTTTNVSIWGSVNTCRLQVALQMDDPHHQSVNQQNKIKPMMNDDDMTIFSGKWLLVPLSCQTGSVPDPSCKNWKMNGDNISTTTTTSMTDVTMSKHCDGIMCHCHVSCMSVESCMSMSYELSL